MPDNGAATKPLKPASFGLAVGVLDFSETQGAFGGGGIHDAALLSDFDFPRSNQSACSLAGLFHPSVPISGEYGAGRLARADGRVFWAFGKQAQDGLFKGMVVRAGAVASAGL